MRKILKKMGLAVLLAMVVLSACKGKETAADSQSEAAEPSWQDQYELGIRLLNEGNYDEAVLAFTAAIRIDPKQAAAYVGRGDAYVGWEAEARNTAEEAAGEGEELVLSDVTVGTGDTVYSLEELLQQAADDYQEALELLESGEASDTSELQEEEINEKLADTLIELAEILLENPEEEGNLEKAQEYLEQAAELTTDPEKLDHIRELTEKIEREEQAAQPARLPVGYRMVTEYQEDSGELPQGWTRLEYDEEGRKIREINVDADGNDLDTNIFAYDKNGHELPWYYISAENWIYDDNGLVVETASQKSDGSMSVKARCFYDADGNLSEVQWMFQNDGTPGYIIYYSYDSENKLQQADFYNQGGTVHDSSTFYRYDGEGRLIQEETQTYWYVTSYGYEDYEYNEAGQLVRISAQTGGEIYAEIEYLYNDAGELVRENHNSYDMEVGINYYVEYIYE